MGKIKWITSWKDKGTPDPLEPKYNPIIKNTHKTSPTISIAVECGSIGYNNPDIFAKN